MCNYEADTAELCRVYARVTQLLAGIPHYWLFNEGGEIRVYSGNTSICLFKTTIREGRCDDTE